MFKKRKKEKECPEKTPALNPEKTPALNKAAEVAAQYKQLSACCQVLAKLSQKEYDIYSSMYSGGFRLCAGDITGSGIDIEEVYEHLRKLALKRRLELEIELGKLDV